MITGLRGFRSLRDMLKTNFIAEGRKVKEAAGGMFYDSSALISFIRFNFLLRRTMIELMHADLIAIRTGLQQLEAAGTRTLDCRQSGFAASEPVVKIRQFADEWKQPFQKDYTELQQLAAKSGAPAASRAPAPAAESAATPPKVAAKQAKVLEPATEPEPDLVLDFEDCLEQIWEQLIATPPMRGRSMTTVKIGRARILMSSWEVTAFVSEDSSAADDLRRAVVARAMVTAAIEAAKETGNATGLDRALSVARVEVSRLQERVDVAKQAKDTEAAVNLGISTKRLLSALDEAEKL
jgi:hypothetical protein